MSRTLLSFEVADLSSFARALRRELPATPELTHVRVLNLVARAAGFANVQHLRAHMLRRSRPVADPEPVDAARVARALRLFDAEGCMLRWPKQMGLQHLAMWAIWARLPARVELDERQVSAALTRLHGFGDPAILRRTLVELGLFTRTRDGRVYRRVERRPGPEARALIAALSPRAA